MLHGAGYFGSSTEPLRNVVCTTRAIPPLFGSDESSIPMSEKYTQPRAVDGKMLIGPAA